jgi:purine-binding chemotaxis protein CheW
MTAVAMHSRSVRSSEQQYATFYVGPVLLGVDIRVVQEINRQSEITEVPHAPKHVRGVINLRGEVATVVDLRTMFGLPRISTTRDSRNLIVHSRGEAIGLWVDRISDILTLRGDEIGPPPANVSTIDGRFIAGVHPLEDEILVLLDVEKVLSDIEQ